MERYAEDKRIGNGTYGTATLCTEKDTGRKVVVCSYSKEVFHGERLSYASQEVSVLRLIDHPNVVKLIESFEDDDNEYIVTEYMDKGSLLDLLREEGRLEEYQIVPILRQLLSALSYLHEKRILHKDIKPENILMDSSGNVKLCSFGISSVLEPGQTSGTMVFTRDYCAPELLTMGECDGKYDVWSLGVVLYEMCVGSLPFDNHLAAIEGHIKPIPGTVHSFLREMIVRMLTANPTKRYTAKSLLNALNKNFRERLKNYKCRLTADSLEVKDINRTDVFKFKASVGAHLRLYANEETNEEVLMEITPKQSADLERIRGVALRMEEIESPFVVNHLWSFEDDDSFYAVTECPERRSLRDLLSMNGALNEDVVVRFLWQMLSAVRAFQGADFVCGGLSPDCVLLNAHMCIRIRVGTDGGGMTSYTPPEIARSRPHRGIDLWSVGVMGFEMCAGRVPVMESMKGELKALSGSINSSLLKVIEMMLNQSPKKRSSPEELLGILRSEYGNVESLNLWVFEGDSLKAMGFNGCEHFKMEKVLGNGGFGTTFLYRGESTRPVVLKVCDKAKSKTGYSREVMTMRKVRHPRIVQFFGSFEDKESYYIVMEFVEGGDLEQCIEKRGFVDECTSIRILWQLLSAVSCLHKRNIVHKDIKPQNILLDSNMNVKLADFGISKQLDVLNPFGETQQCSYDYAAPELFKTGKYNTKYDIWGIGFVFYNALMGRSPFETPEQKQTGNFQRLPKSYGKFLAGLVAKMFTVSVLLRPNVEKLREMVVKEYGDLSKGVQAAMHDGTLLLSGEGFMESFSSEAGTPWAHSKESIERVAFRGKIRSIGDYAFAGCANIHQLSLPNGIMFIGRRAFAGCQQLGEVNLPESVKTIGSFAFEGCPLETGRVPYKVTEIDEGLFKGCEKMRTARLTAYVSSIGESAFEGCVQLSEMSPLPSLVLVGKRAFFGCECLSSIYLPSGVTVIEDEVFCNCTQLGEIILPPTLERIGKRSFSRSGIKTIDVPSTVTSIGDGAFLKCTCLTSVLLHPNLCEIGVCGFSGCSKLTSINLPDTLVRIGGSAFKSCRKLGEVELPPNLERIERRSFYRCNLKSVTIPGKVVSIGSGAFGKCSQLERVDLRGVVDSIAKDAFSETLVDTSAL